MCLAEREPAIGPARVDPGGLHQCPGRARLHALATGHTGAVSHRIIEVKHDLGLGTALRHADDVVDLHLSAGPHAEIAMDAGVEAHPHGRMTGIGRRSGTGGKAAAGHVHAIGPLPQPCLPVWRLGTGRLVGEQKFHHHGAGPLRPGALRADHHVGFGPADARCGKRPLAVDLHHADAAVSVRPITTGFRKTQMRQVEALALRHLPQRLVVARLNRRAVEREPYALTHGSDSRPLGNAAVPNSGDWRPPAPSRRWMHRPWPRRVPRAAARPSAPVP